VEQEEPAWAGPRLTGRFPRHQGMVAARGRERVAVAVRGLADERVLGEGGRLRRTRLGRPRHWPGLVRVPVLGRVLRVVPAGEVEEAVRGGEWAP
jgi:hypothetical protein